MSSCELEEENFRHCCLLFLQQSEQLRDSWSWEQVQGSQEGYLRKTALRTVVINSSPVWDQAGSSSDSGPHISCPSRPDEQAALIGSADADLVQGSQEGYLRKTALRTVVINSSPVWDQAGSSSDSGPHISCPSRPDEQAALIGSADADIIRGPIEDEDDDEGVCMAWEGCSQVLQYEYHVLYSCSYRTPVLYFRAVSLEGRSLSLEEVWSSIHPNFRLRLQSSPLSTVSQQEHPLLGQPFFMLHPCRTQDFMRPVLQAAQDQHRPVNYVLTWLSVVGPVVGLDIPLKYSTQLHPVAPLSSSEPD